MKVGLPSNYKSLPPFDPIDLPPFTVLVGLNGAGKSQILEAIQLRKATCSALTPASLEMQGESHFGVVRLTNASLNLQSEMFVTANSANNAVSREIFDGHRNKVFEQYAPQLKSVFKGTVYAELQVSELMGMSRKDLVGDPDDRIENDPKTQQRSETLDRVNDTLATGHYHNAHAPAQQAINRVITFQKKEARLVTFDDIQTFGSWGDHAPFNAYLPRLFAGYRAERIANDRLEPKHGNPAKVGWLDSEAFIEKFGIAPWDQLSSTMATFGLNYRIAPPGKRAIDPIVLYFERLNDDGMHIEFSSLSAGEKVLVILAVSLLNIDPLRAAIQRPELLLLDEIDASLHPAVLHQWMTTIREKVVAEMNIPCIMTTHSPVTVALAPEDSLFEMRRADAPLAKTTQREALNKLTVGLPSMEVDFTQRRQVFVEADVDAAAYDRLHTLIKAELQLSRSLHFLSTGIKNKQGVEQGTGCSAVQKVVEDLASFGNLSTFGLLDWDGKRSTAGRLHVLGEGTHYAFDNVIMNPLLVGLLLIRNGCPPSPDLPRFAGIDRLNDSDLQQIANSVQTQLKYPDGAPTGTVSTRFIGGREVMTDKAFCHCNGHDMEAALTTAFPSLKKFTQQRGKLALAIIEGVVGDYPTLCPEPIAKVFQVLSDVDP